MAEASTRAHRRRGWAAPTAVLAALIGLGTACVPPPPPPGDTTSVVVFDIDGTLTADELSQAAQPGAAAAVQRYIDKGYTVVYVTARWSLLESSTRSWLASNGFPERPLFMAPGLLFTEDQRVDFKTDALAGIEDSMEEVLYAYGDSSSDFEAYANAGVARSNVYALRRASASSCQAGAWTACLSGYTSHLSFINGLPQAS
jgi:phosphatidate phosphatase PAH1